MIKRPYQEYGAGDGEGLFEEVGGAVEEDDVVHVVGSIMLEEESQ